MPGARPAWCCPSGCVSHARAGSRSAGPGEVACDASSPGSARSGICPPASSCRCAVGRSRSPTWPRTPPGCRACRTASSCARCDAYAWLTVEDLYAGLPSTPLRREPGGRPRYSNLGYGLLGHALAFADAVAGAGQAGPALGRLGRRRPASGGGQFGDGVGETKHSVLEGGLGEVGVSGQHAGCAAGGVAVP
jgi:hypothetical protein